MPTLTVTKTYKDGNTLAEADLDGIKTSIETFMNTTKLDSSNIQSGGIATANIASLAITSALLATAVSQSLNPAGTILAYGGISAPSGYLACDGSAVSRSTYATLFTAIGTTWGSGDGSTTFNLPNLSRKALVGSGGTGTSTLANSVGSTGGSETHTLTVAELPSHNHTLTDPGHSHAETSDAGAGAGSSVIPASLSSKNPAGVTTDGNNTATATTGITIASAGSGTAHSIMQPSAVVLMIIKT